jgi:hypothetical protein
MVNIYTINGGADSIATIATNLARDDFAFAIGNTIIIDGGTVLL